MHKYISLVSIIAIATTLNASAAETLYVAGFGGSVETAFREKIIPPFEAKTGAKIIYAPGNSTDTLAKLRAQNNNEQISVAIIDDAPMSLAIKSGLCAKLEDRPNSKNVYPSARRAGGEAIGLGYGDLEQLAGAGGQHPTAASRPLQTASAPGVLRNGDKRAPSNYRLLSPTPTATPMSPRIGSS